MKVGLIIGLAVASLLVYLIATSTMRGPRYRVEVCMYFNGRLNCRTVSARSEDAALKSGIQNACADIASGVNESFGCEGSQPKSVKWLQRPTER